MTNNDHIVNPQLIGMAMDAFAKSNGPSKQAFVAAGDPSMDPMAAGGDPAAAGGAPPMDPAMAGGAPGGAPGGGADPGMIADMVIQKLQGSGLLGGGGGAGAGGAGGMKPKIDVNVEIMQMKKILARIGDAMGIQMPMSEMTATPEDLAQMAAGEQPGVGGETGMGGPAEGAGQSAIQPIEPMQAAAPGLAAAGGGGGGGGEKLGAHENGAAFKTDGFTDTLNTAAAIASIQQHT